MIRPSAEHDWYIHTSVLRYESLSSNKVVKSASTIRSADAMDGWNELLMLQ